MMALAVDAALSKPAVARILPAESRIVANVEDPEVALWWFIRKRQ
jgi:hypothetical protein